MRPKLVSLYETIYSCKSNTIVRYTEYTYIITIYVNNLSPRGILINNRCPFLLKYIITEEEDLSLSNFLNIMVFDIIILPQ